MIKKIRIEGFQSHLNTTINLCKNVNLIVGGSDKGKSAIIRSLKWAFRNKPRGDSFRNRDLNEKDNVKITSIFEDNSGIIRERGKSKNQYRISTSKNPLKALKTDVPDEVQEITRIKDVNIQSQHPNDQYFLLTDSPGQVAKKFNRVAGLEIVDKVTSELNKSVRTLDTKVKYIETEIEELENKYAELDWVPIVHQKAKKLDTLKKEVNIKLRHTETIRKIIESINNIDLRMGKYSDIDAAMKSLAELMKGKNAIARFRTKIDNIKRILNSLVATEKSLNEYVDINEALNELEEIKKTDKSIKLLESSCNNTEIIVNQIDNINKSLNATEKMVTKMEKEFKKVLGEGCPLCGKK